MMVTLDLRSILRQRRDERTGDVNALARRLARGEAVPPEEILEIVSTAGVDDEALLDLVDLHQRRDELRRQARGLAAAEQEATAARAAIAKHRARLDEAEAAYRQAVEPLARQEQEADARARAAASAESELTSSKNLPAAIVAGIEAARAAVLKAGRAVGEKEAELDRQVRRGDDATAKLGGGYGVEKALADLLSGKLLWHEHRVDHEAAEALRSSRHRVGVLREELAELVAAHAAAEKEYARLQKEAREF